MSFGMGEAEDGAWGRPCAEFPVAQMEMGRPGLRAVVTQERREQLEAALAQAFASEQLPGPGLARPAGPAGSSVESAAESAAGSGPRFAGSLPAVSESFWWRCDADCGSGGSEAG